MNDRDSASDWDSMSEREETPPKRSNDVEDFQPPFDFSSEVTKSEMVPEPSGSRRTNRPRKARNYQVPAKAGTKDPNRFSSPALRSIEGHSSKSDPQRLPGFEPKAGLAEEPKSQEPRQKQVIHAQETLDDIRSDPLDDHDYKDSSEGIANPAFLPDSQYVLEEKRDSLSVQESRHHPSKPVKPEESIEILLFRPAETKFFQIHPEDSGLWADKALKPAVHCLSRSVAEILGILKIPFVLVFVAIGQILNCLIQSAVSPGSNWILKPLIVATHNHICVPLCSGLHNICSLLAQAMSPICYSCSSAKSGSDSLRDIKEV